MNNQREVVEFLKSELEGKSDYKTVRQQAQHQAIRNALNAAEQGASQETISSLGFGVTPNELSQVRHLLDKQ